nr:hypothetical protein [Ferrimicrobium sp.]
MSTEQILDLLPGLRIHQGFMESGVGDAPIEDLSLVIRVAEQFVQSGDRQRLGWPLGRCSCGKSPSSQFIEQRPKRWISFGVAKECPGDHVRSLGIDLHGSVDSSERIVDMDVSIAKWCPRDGATDAGFLDQSFSDLVGEIAGVKLGDATHDPVHKHPRWSLVDVFAGADECDPCLLQGEVDRDVIGTGPSETVKLMNDAVIHVMFPNIGQHALEFRPLGH